MSELPVIIHPSDLPPDEKEQRLRDVLKCLLRSKKENEKQVNEEREQNADTT